MLIQDEESYVYLAAVQGLSVLADAAPLHCIPRLVALFCGTPQPLSPAAATATAASASISAAATSAQQRSNSSSSKSESTTSTVTEAQPPQQQLQQQQHQQQQQQQPTLAQRLKLGEAVMFAARRCGEAMPVYARYFVGAFVVGARERVSDVQQDEVSAVSEVGLAVTTATKERIHFRARSVTFL
jgi:Required for nuclear transport of RNA pol II C-terminus 1